ncbi:CopG family transcriptional regulator [Moraxella osloensis]|nr:CopG family transcriptional regulator [Moraxella osloensis]
MKDNRINARFDDIELDEIIEIANLDGLQKSSLVRLATLEYIQKRKEEYAEKLKAMKEAS